MIFIFTLRLHDSFGVQSRPCLCKYGDAVDTKLLLPCRYICCDCCNGRNKAEGDGGCSVCGMHWRAQPWRRGKLSLPMNWCAVLS